MICNMVKLKEVSQGKTSNSLRLGVERPFFEIEAGNRISAETTSHINSPHGPVAAQPAQQQQAVKHNTETFIARD